MQTLGERLRWAREASGLSQRALSARAQLKSPRHVGLIELDTYKTIEGTTAAQIAGVLGVSLDWLLSGTGEQPTAEAIRESAGRAA